MSRHAANWLLAAALIACSQGALARSSDRNQPMDIDAGATSGTLDDRQPTVLSGGVTIKQGTLHIEAGQATVSTRGGDPVRAVLTGGPVRLRQQMDDGTQMNAVANKVDYDLTTEIVVFTDTVRIQQPRGSLSGERVVYNMRTGQVNSGGEGNGRVKMRIVPRNAGTTPAPGGG
ncbi:lipopolysaccharide transport periplasmic protein LptA [Montanilutibacter psychrotolerans]|uniref:Lipopolysaccharide export system protein LptA n=1 Tax=Montanilutibacter psychrotolerans TaxID=1327343 RepID=A0A3M8SXK4_9GAMM|nr:lipopolysaccharide transport periplasmic protein LptA [Lysobacter psychrotolerans]RNF86047.1 lipopolysaccharide transport periplasmic protein LptA [Lysobacter psychrotolerans]